jgi:hypothetical protein
VNLCLTINGDGETVIALNAWHTIDEQQLLQREIVDIYDFDNTTTNFAMMERYIEDFSEISAIIFVKQFNPGI